MKNILLWSRATDRKILVVAGCACALGFAASIGLVLPTPVPSDKVPLIDGLMTALLLVIVWGGFRLVRPARHSRRWVVAEFITIPVVWIFLVVVLALWFNHLRDAWEVQIHFWEEIVPQRV